MVKFMGKIGDRIRILRARDIITQRHLAEQSGCPEFEPLEVHQKTA